ncbi:alpha-mannosidase [filamentous cyanobacterium LEGE 11480]|uniref:Alpha-mannosidase n=2 Tax=Romeriopsis TaxID=2992131 RepID=A0A928Z673_9CYAN|nr:alpha-mannosidase [Romeriopsis navalis LEGE 11480]
MLSPTEQAIQSWIERLRSQVQRDTIANWRTETADQLAINAKGHIAWEKGLKPLTLMQTLTLPSQLEDYPLAGLTARLALTWWAEAAQVFVNGELVQEGDLFDHSVRLVLSREAKAGETFEVVVKLISPGHDDGALMRSRLIFEADFEADYTQIDPGFVADEVAVIEGYLKAFEPEGLVAFLAVLQEVLPSGESPQLVKLATLRDRLTPYSYRIKQHTISLLGHAHLDMAWLWTVADTWKAAERTFDSVLSLQKDFPEMVFCHTTPLLYDWMEQYRPDLFTVIKQQIEAGQWEALGGMWVEPELNLVDAESIVRQILYGQQYYQTKFGFTSRIAWLPDTFGFCWQLPQLLKQGGMDYFVTQKLRWNDTTRYPHERFNWQAPDGTVILSFMSPPIGEGIDPIKLSDYCWEWTQRTGGDRHPMWLPGMGDHGGGPTRDMLEIVRRWQTSPFFPELVFESAAAYLARWDTAVAPSLQPENLAESSPAVPGLEAEPDCAEVIHSQLALPTHHRDIYLELHRGCYTVHADQKAFNRDSQNALYSAELWSSIAALLLNRAYPKQKLETAWKQVLLNQFHDILPGSSITAVYDEANPAWQAAIQTGNRLTQQALKALFTAIDKPAPPVPNATPIVVFNALNWRRSALARVAHPNIEQTEHPCLWKIYPQDHPDDLTKFIPAYVEPDAKAWENVWVEFPVNDMPACGYRLYWLVTETQPFDQAGPSEGEYTIENEFLKVEIDINSGDIVQLWDKHNQRDVFADYANQIELFQDAGQYWDAWNIDPEYEQYPLPPSQHFDVVRMESLYIQELWAVGQGGSRGYVLEAGCPWLTIKAQLKGDERHVMQKACFPLNLEADYATYETAAGAITRTTRPQTIAEKVQWEVPGLRWADMTHTDGSYGVSILSDRKHGYDHTPNQIRLTLLRGTEWPDPEADKGSHHFSYAIYPHTGSWKTANTVQKAREMSQPLQSIIGVPMTAPAIGTLPAEGTFLEMNAQNLVLMTLKQSEANPQTYILRCYESQGETAIFNPTGLLLKSRQLGDRLNLLEQPQAGERQFTPWQIASFQI